MRIVLLGLIAAFALQVLWRDWTACAGIGVLTLAVYMGMRIDRRERLTTRQREER